MGAATSRSAALAMSSKILKLKRVMNPKAAKGELTLASEKNISMVADWLSDFAAEAVPHDTGKGYASNMVAQVSKSILESGKEFCVLYADAANPTSNRIYQDIGYEIVAESAHWVLK